MSLWPYSGTNAAGLPVKGKVVADDVEGAKSRLTKMSVKWEKVGDEVVEELSVPEAKSAEQAAEVIKSFQKTSDIPQGVPPRPKPILPQPVRKTKQFFLFGPGPQVKSESLPLLERGGKVVHASMSPDSSGRPHVMLVIEAEEEQSS